MAKKVYRIAVIAGDGIGQEGKSYAISTIIYPGISFEPAV